MNGTQTRAAYFLNRNESTAYLFYRVGLGSGQKLTSRLCWKQNYSIWRWKQTGVQDRKTTVRGSLPISRLLHFSRLTCYSKFRRFLLALFVCDVVRTYYAYARGAGNYGK